MKVKALKSVIPHSINGFSVVKNILRMMKLSIIQSKLFSTIFPFDLSNVMHVIGSINFKVHERANRCTHSRHDTLDIQIALCIANTKGLTFLHSSNDHPILATISWFLNTKALWVSRIWWMTCNY